jgi:class 3 adenylate cyclase/tetratricopeptide (TPR) repeat protein
LICSKCGVANEPGAKFCNQCGTGLLSGCPSCGTINAPNARFCSECASPLSVEASRVVAAQSTVPVAPIAERRLVSVLFADLVGFTSFSEDRDAEEVRETLSRYFELASKVIGRYGGTVEKFIGDAVMAVWGAPTAQEDDAERAVRAALELVDAIPSLGSGIEARAGVLTGEAAVTVGATNQGMVAGDLVNTASRLQSVAPAGAVLVGETTERAASRAIVFEPAGEQLLKGKVTPVPAWRALRVVAEVGGRNRSETLEAPFVGRDDELRLLKDLFHATERERRARLVSVIGPAGIGKTRLAWEFLKYVDGLVDGVWWHEGRSPAYGDGITFWALGQMIRRRAGLLESDDETATRAKIAATVAEHVPDRTEAAWIEPALLALLGIESGLPSEQLFGAWRAFFERLAATSPVVMVFEDFHFADDGLLDFVDHLLDWSKGAPIYVLTLSRPELIERRPQWGVGKRSFTSLHLEPLAEPAMRLLLAGLVPGLDDLTVRSIVARADGIPLYAVETVRMLVAEGRLAQAGGSYVPAGDLSSLAVPETLTALISSRLDALDPGDRALIQDASVLGQSFTVDGLAAVSGRTTADVVPRLPSLIRRELLVLDADPRSPERGQYAFVQALIREVAYGTLARKDRKARHLAAARYLETLDSEEIAGALAGHYLAAHRNSAEGEEADALAGQARLAFTGAAERAAALGSHDQAVRFYEHALGVTRDPAEQADTLERAGGSASISGRHDAAERYLARAIEIRRSLGDQVATARTTVSYARTLISARKADIARAMLESARVEFADVPDDWTMPAVLGQLARAYFLDMSALPAIEVAGVALDLAEHRGLTDIVADTLVTKGSALAGAGRPIEGLALLRAGQELAERNDLIDVESRALGNRIGFENDVNPRAAFELGKEALARSARLGVRNGVIVTATIGAALDVGEWGWAETALSDALIDYVDPSERAEIIGFATWFAAMRGDPTEALVAEHGRLLEGVTDTYRLQVRLWFNAAVAWVEGRLREARSDWIRVIDAFEAPNALWYPARAALWEGDLEGARTILVDFDARGARTPPLDAQRRAIRAGIAALDGRPADSLPLYREALEAVRELGLRCIEAIVTIDMATLLDPTDPFVAEAAQRGRAILAELGAKPFLARLDAALAAGSRVAGQRAVAPVEEVRLGVDR